MEYSEDAIFHGALRLRQHGRGYRFTEDAVLLAAFAAERGPVGAAVDCGAGCGVVGLMLLHRGVAGRAVALELQAGLAALARHNATANGLEGRLRTVRADLRRMPLRAGSVDLVVSNPPYQPVDAASRAMLPGDPERALARHEVACSPVELAREAARCLAPGGRLVVVYPARRLAEVRRAMAAAGLDAHRVRPVRPAPSRPPAIALIEASRSCWGACQDVIAEAPFVTRDEAGQRTREMEQVLAGDWPIRGRSGA